MEHLKIIDLFAGTGIKYRFSGDGQNGQCSASPGVCIEFGQYHPVDADAFVERVGDVHGFLTGERVYYQDRAVREIALQALKLFHQDLVYLKTSRGIYDNDIVTVIFRFRDSASSYLMRISLSHLEDRHARSLTHDLQLFNGSRPINVTGDQQRSVPLVLEHLPKLRTVCGLSSALKAAHQYHRGRSAFKP